ncbi:hypothetical protein [Flexithrix dorotheae]|uniref:hypothetical protein n=1 Tax=Flexithrix dorotheae TaxID=70993 RepID=UPI000365D32F|nr:hypothetical protein [Flexithrix dorotheae]
MSRVYFHLRKFPGRQAKIYYRLYGKNTQDRTTGTSTGLSIWPKDWNGKMQLAVAGKDKGKINFRLLSLKKHLEGKSTKSKSSALNGIGENAIESSRENNQEGNRPMENQLTIKQPGPGSYANWQEYVIADLREKVGELKQRNAELETKSREDDQKLLELEKEVAFKDKEHELDLQGKDLERGNGLGGIVEKVASNEHLSALAGVIISRLLGTDMPAGNGQLFGEEMRPDNRENKMISAFEDWFLRLSEHEQTKVWNLILVLSNSTNLLEKIDSLIEKLKNGIPTRFQAN